MTNNGWNNIIASRYQTAFDNKGQPQNAVPFIAVYDARNAFTVKNDMDAYPSRRLKMNNVVLMETFIKRYKWEKSVKHWQSWNVILELQEVSLIHTAANALNI
ncbi:hypothetical protein SERLA73DRAFT_173997 [Serpula lacrymans var. lacrymans S7.3]|uniref:Uncharacterized protein n=2 Tax=Serpula lacrymans var. lacrymans TaxID=341189 RepID=F8PH14_SERL3|nr:uncharacterized protein SERLADRAFT_454999 [Serpula lacrymans var. lacrymans S7.9]EGO04910.1 hypothetical protein SERLA73DRAFT_173997 [Serpula lacrymans var. lacrymans S7.3]EGO30720.1 hypothetical protein SERLADRAFT_454999 [Serpula lacrymans var. lacrymans S7.9]